MSAATVTTACPSWCTGEHENRTGQAVTPAGDLYGGEPVHASAPSQHGAGPAVYLEQYEEQGRTVHAVVVDQFEPGELSEGDAHELGMALVRAAARIRRARMEAQA